MIAPVVARSVRVLLYLPPGSHILDRFNRTWIKGLGNWAWKDMPDAALKLSFEIPLPVTVLHYGPPPIPQEAEPVTVRTVQPEDIDALPIGSRVRASSAGLTLSTTFRRESARWWRSEGAASVRYKSRDFRPPVVLLLPADDPTLFPVTLLLRGPDEPVALPIPGDCSPIGFLQWLAEHYTEVDAQVATAHLREVVRHFLREGGRRGGRKANYRRRLKALESAARDADKTLAARWTTQRCGLAEAMRDFHRDHRALFGDTGSNPVGWAHMADALRAAGWIITTTDDDMTADMRAR